MTRGLTGTAKALVALAALIPSCAPALAPIHAAAAGPTLVLHLNGRVGFAPLAVLAHVRVLDPQRELFCPSFELDWEVGRSAWESDCDPEARDGSPTLYVEPQAPRWLKFYTPGTYEVTARVKSAQLRLVDRATVIVHGMGEP